VKIAFVLNETDFILLFLGVDGQTRDGNLFLWDVALIVLNSTSLYHGAYLKVCVMRWHRRCQSNLTTCLILIRVFFIGGTRDPQKLPNESTKVSFYETFVPPKYLQGRQTLHLNIT
jgi:hypothetical protein